VLLALRFGLRELRALGTVDGLAGFPRLLLDLAGIGKALRVLIVCLRGRPAAFTFILWLGAGRASLRLLAIVGRGCSPSAA
jgi:hypothetical protein